ncbi:AAA family ATPase [Flavobacterium zepuense]|uniref:DNA 3'-5' helicase II n=1 Tax=Flavobacterium zepuense TaxID=2593302 RepID=A0A552UZG7_9FLAO|nr:UvrD-helicase domain-containing protein [Flavobacterium zepuense]TRW23616.1 AAA family ATPase [Flavobacterium zepuense]
MLPEINVLEEDIKYAESILLPGGKVFDDERREFIKNFETIDLQAVPGSGKTTALLAKLLILETRLPLLNNRGVLILSHTNTAVDEIKEKIGKHCPKLFSYPNFIGTIQSFVDQFLAIPYYQTKYKNRPYRIDNEIYNETVDKLFSAHLKGFNLQESKNAKYFIRSNEGIIYKYRLSFADNKLDIISALNKNSVNVVKPRRGKDWQDFTQHEKDRVIKWMVSFKLKILLKGILHFDDAYFLSEIYLKRFPKIKMILQKRFKYIFVDEMQDVDIHQYDLLEKIFYDNDNSLSNYQRIGDKNQAIYNGDVGLDEIWIFRDNGRTKNINGSQRLSQNIAELVDCLALSRDGNFKIEGKNENCNLKPHLIVYSLENIKNVIPKFSEIIYNYIASGDIEITQKNKYKVIGWSRDKINDINKLGIKDYYEELITNTSKQKIDYENLDSYLIFFDKDKRTLEPVRKNILNALIKILRFEDIYFSKRELLDYLETTHAEKYIDLKRNLYLWSINLVRNKFEEVYLSVKSYVPDFLYIFGKNINESSSFINTASSTQQIFVAPTPVKNPNQENFHGFDINISTIHSVKGETHTATLYLETYYQNGNDNYETQRLSDQFKFANFCKTKKYHKQSTKMAYVGFSRPTHLLCVAVCKTRFDSHLRDINADKWNIIEI